MQENTPSLSIGLRRVGGLSMKRLTFTMKVKEPVSAFSHLFGVIMAIVAIAVLTTYAALDATAWHVLAFAIYGSCMLLVFSASTLYHWLPLRPSQEKLFKRLDHSAIYLMIAGSYTPIALIGLKGPTAWSLLGLIWTLAVIGVAREWRPQSRIRINKSRWKTVILFIAMGWVCVAYAYPIVQALPLGAVVWLALGGLAFSAGAVIYSVRAPNPIPQVVGFHEVFHIFVVIGAMCHLWMMVRYILPMPLAF